jgi:transposase
MTREDLHEMYRRWRAGHPIQQMARAIQGDRKTIRHYLNKFQQAGLSQAGPEVDKQALEELFDTILPATERVQPARQELSCYEQLIREWIQDEREPVKPKSAYQILRSTYHIRASYESFKLFVRQKGLNAKSKKQVLRIELPPGQEQQIDYGRVGWLEDPRGGQNRVVWAFCTVLSCSRLPFIQYVYTQRQVAFADSLIDALEFYQGTTEFISIDNLKSGVTKPDLWDPVLNKTLAEVADYYGLFINPCRVGKSTDKGKVERLVPLARELFRRLKKEHPTAGLPELNRWALRWCREEYGRREHGTTGIAPLQAFEEGEKATLRPLPAERFETPVWKEVAVHAGDGFLTFGDKRFAVPAYRGRRVWVRYSERSRLLRIFSQGRLIREYVVGAQRVNYLPGDFPQAQQALMQGSYPQYLLRQAVAFGPDAQALIERVLQPHAYLNARRAKGILEVMADYQHQPFFATVCRQALHRGVKLPARFRAMLADEQHQLKMDFRPLPISPTGERMIREISYYIR